jgi:predicted amidohydrolase
MPFGSKIRVALVQFSPSCANLSENLKIASALIGSKKADIFVFPHLFSTAARAEEASRMAEGNDGPTLLFLRKLAEDKKAFVLGSYLAKSQSKSSSKKPFIRSIALNPAGQAIGIYDAIHLCSICGEPDYLSYGKKLPFFDLLTFRSCMISSYDLRFPEIAREFALSNGFLLFVQGAFRRSERKAWDSLLAARAVENQMFCIGCNFGASAQEQANAQIDCYGGGSAVFAPDGRKIHQAGAGEQVLIVDIDPFEVEWNRTRYQFLTDAKLKPSRARKIVHESPLDKEA